MCHSSRAYGGTTPQADRDEPPRWQLYVGVVASALFLCNLHRSCFSVLLPLLKDDFQLSMSHAGLLQSVSLGAYLVGQMPSGYLADRFGGIRVLLVGLVLWSLATASTALASCPQSLNWLWWSRILLGLCSSCIMTCVAATTSRWVPQEDRATAVAFIYACFNVGGVAGLALPPLIAQQHGWPVAFLVCGVVGVAWALACALNLAGKAKAPAQPPPPAILTGSSGSHPGATSLGPKSSGFPRVEGRDVPHVVVLCLTHAVIGWGFFIMQNWLPMYLTALREQQGAPLSHTGLTSSMPWLAASLMGMLVGNIADGMVKYGLRPLTVRKIMQTVSSIGCAVSLLPLMMSSSPSTMLAVVCLTFNLSFYACSYGGFHAHLQDVAGGRAGLLQGITNTFSILFGILGSWATGMLVDSTGSYGAVFMCTIALHALAAGMWLVGARERKIAFV